MKTIIAIIGVLALTACASKQSAPLAGRDHAVTINHTIYNGDAGATCYTFDAREKPACYPNK